MEPGHHLQLALTVALILTAAVVAFICDILKRNNQLLREMNIELELRQEQTQRVESAPRPAPAVAHVAVSAEPAAKERMAVNREKKRTVNAEAIAAMERGAARAGSRPEAIQETVTPDVKIEVKPEPKLLCAPPVKTAVRKDWGSLLHRNAEEAKQAPALKGFQAGFHDGFVLNQLVQSHQPISGLVVSIGVNAPRTSGGKLPEAVSKLVESLIGPNDFAARSGEDEFLLIYPHEKGAAAQRKLSRIAQQLWDFQLRSLGSFQILFSWGGVEVQSESIEEAIASASERMLETRRGRKLVMMESRAVEPREKLRETG